MSKTSLLSPRLSRTDRVRLMAQVMPTAACDVWLGAVGRDGYGRFSLTRPGGGERIVTSHLAAATIAFGPIPLGATLMHDCDVRICVSTGPGDLRVATQRENVRQAVRRGRAAGPKPGLVDVRGPAGASRAVQDALRAVAADRLSAAELAVVAYYRGMVSSRAFAALDTHMWRLTHKWARYSHANKSKHWIMSRYFGVFNKSRRDRWVFGDRDSGAYLFKFAWTKIVRHQMVKGSASPDDPALADYWNTRRRRNKPPLDSAGLRLLMAQHGRCPLCGDYLLHADRGHKAQSNGRSGSPSPAKRSGNKRSPPTRDLARRTNPSRSVSYTPTAPGTPLSAVAWAHTLCLPDRPQGLARAVCA